MLKHHAILGQVVLFIKNSFQFPKIYLISGQVLLKLLIYIDINNFKLKKLIIKLI